MLTVVHDQVCITGQQLIPVDKGKYREEEEHGKGKERERDKIVFFVLDEVHKTYPDFLAAFLFRI